MKDKELLRAKTKKRSVQSAKECAYIAVFVAILISVQLALSFVPGVELVTVFFVTYSFVMGIKRGVISAFAFTAILIPPAVQCRSPYYRYRLHRCSVSGQLWKAP